MAEGPVGENASSVSPARTTSLHPCAGRFCVIVFPHNCGYNHYATDYIYEYEGKYPVKVTAVVEGGYNPHFERYYEY